MKPKTNRKGNKNESNKYDRCQTPWYALDPILQFIPRHWTIWEPAAGDGQIADKLESDGYEVICTELLRGENYFEDSSIPARWDCQLTNPPYSIKYEWLMRAYSLGKPFALLLPLETLGAAAGQRLFQRYGMELVLMDKRINFRMPGVGYGDSGAQFPVSWFTWGLGIGQPVTYTIVNRYPDGQMLMELEA